MLYTDSSCVSINDTLWKLLENVNLCFSYVCKVIDPYPPSFILDPLLSIFNADISLEPFKIFLQ